MNLIKSNTLTGYLLMVIVSILMLEPAYASIENDNDAVNKSGKQRMLTQRMLKDYAMLGMGNTFGQPGEDLQQQIKLFDTSLHDLQQFNQNASIAKSLIKTETLWLPIKQQLKKKPTIEAAADLQKLLDDLLNSCHETTTLLVKMSGRDNSQIINISGRQRMLSQRLAALYMLKVWGINDDNFKQKLEQTMNDFSQAQKKLEASSHNTAQIKSSLQKVKKLFMWFELMANSTSGRYIPSLISKSSDKINSEMNTVTKLYIQVLK